MGRPVCYDVTRLLTRVVNPTPNGIDRVDHALATHFLAGPAFGCAYAGVGTCLISDEAARAVVDGIAGRWGERRSDVDAEPAFRHVVARLAGRPSTVAAARRHRPPLPVPAAARWLARHGPDALRSPRRHLPQGSAYVNTSQFPLWLSGPFEWLETRRDVRAAFFVHDLLPVELPEYFRRGEPERHRRRLRNVARFASAALVTTRTVADALEAHLAKLGRRDLPVFVRPTPIAATFTAPRVADPSLAGRPYFVLCSTIEPRKNHLMILAVWRALVARSGGDAPMLVLVGTRGWHYDAMIDLVERSPALRSHVVEVGGLSTPGLKRLMDNAQAVLMPSFGEGYGLPVHEALAAGAPVIASDIPAFREIAGADGLTLLSPLDGEAWLAEVARRAGEDRPPERRHGAAEDWAGYFAALDAFIAAL